MMHMQRCGADCGMQGAYGVQLAGPQEEIIREKLAVLGSMASRSGLDMGRAARAPLGVHWMLWTMPAALAGIGAGVAGYYGRSSALGATGGAIGALAAVGILAAINRGRTTKQDELVAQLQALTASPTAPAPSPAVLPTDATRVVTKDVEPPAPQTEAMLLGSMGYAYPEALRQLSGSQFSGLGYFVNEAVTPLG